MRLLFFLSYDRVSDSVFVLNGFDTVSFSSILENKTQKIKDEVVIVRSVTFIVLAGNWSLRH